MLGMAALAASGGNLFGVPIDRQGLYSSVQRQKRPVYIAAQDGKDSQNQEKESQNQEKDSKNLDKNTSLFSSITNALDFSQTRSQRDAELLDDARQATKSGEKMTPQQYAALKRKVGGTYKDFFKETVEVRGEYVESGWVDKRCKICGNDTSTEPRSKDRFGRYAHVECDQAKSKSGNFFSRLFGN